MAGASGFTAIYTAGPVSSTGNTQNEQFVFGVQLTAIPEPSSALLLGIGILGLAGYRRGSLV